MAVKDNSAMNEKEKHMSKIVIIGAGSGFGARLCFDIMSREALVDSEICLNDINGRRLEQVKNYVEKTRDAYGLKTRIRSSTNRRELLEGADFVITAIAVGGGGYYGLPFNDEMSIPWKYGVDQSVGDTLSVGAIFRFLRTGPVQLQILRDVEELAPGALHLNHTNPMSMLSMLHSQQTKLKTVGLCHGIVSTNAVFCRFLGLDPAKARYKVGGVNHLSWFLDWTYEGKNVYELLDAALADTENEKTKQFLIDESVRLEIYRNFGYVPTESNRHDSEYMPYFRRTPELREYYHLSSRKLVQSLEEHTAREWMKDGAGEEVVGKITRSSEYTTGIMEAIVTDAPFRFYGNVPNKGLITNLPFDCSVEVPCFADCNGINTSYLGALPQQCAALNSAEVSVQKLAVEAVVNRDREAAFRAVALDPNVAAVVPLPKIREMFEEMWKADEKHLMWFDKTYRGPVPEICADN